MDYRELLKLYMQHVKIEEGLDFTEFHLPSRDIDFTPEQIEELKQISDENRGYALGRP
jgi:hypothetical protein